MQHLLIHLSSPKKGAAVEVTGTSPVLAVLGGIIPAFDYPAQITEPM